MLGARDMSFTPLGLCSTLHQSLLGSRTSMAKTTSKRECWGPSYKRVIIRCKLYLGLKRLQYIKREWVVLQETGEIRSLSWIFVFCFFCFFSNWLSASTWGQSSRQNIYLHGSLLSGQSNSLLSPPMRSTGSPRSTVIVSELWLSFDFLYTHPTPLQKVSKSICIKPSLNYPNLNGPSGS